MDHGARHAYIRGEQYTTADPDRGARHPHRRCRRAERSTRYSHAAQHHPNTGRGNRSGSCHTDVPGYPAGVALSDSDQGGKRSDRIGYSDPDGVCRRKRGNSECSSQPRVPSGNLARAIVQTGAPGMAATMDPAGPPGDAAAPANAAQPVSTRPTAMLVARVTAAPHGASAPILGSSAIADAVPAASTADASPWSLSSILPWAGAALLLLAFGLVGIVVVLRPGKSGRNGHNSGGQP